MPSPVPLIFLAFSLVWLQAFSQASAQMPSRGIYSDVTLPYLTFSAAQPFLLQQVNHQLVHDFLSQQNNRLFLFWRSPSHGAQPLGLACFTPEFPLTNQAALRCQGEGRGRGWCCWAYPGTKIWKVETQGLARATRPTSRSETWQAGQANSFVGAYKFW